jgi:Tfp pilus assembly protein FimV
MVAITTATTTSPRFPSRPVLVVLPPVTRPGARIYRRRRLAVLGATLSVIAVAVVLASQAFTSAPPTDVRIAPAAASPVVHEPAAYGASGQRVPDRAVYVVQPGDTIWSIARALDPTGDPRAMVDRIAELNGSSALQPGQRLRLT